MTAITLTTDFGDADGFVGIVKGVIYGIAPQSTTIDITHSIAPGDITAGAWILNNSYRSFPGGSIHLAVVDPGVGSKRRGVIVCNLEHSFVLPDNGLISAVIAQPHKWQAFVIDKEEFWLPDPSNTFHGRDIFAPVAAHLSKGVPARKLGTEVGLETLVVQRQAPTARVGSCIVGEVVHVDHFGNLITNIPASELSTASGCRIADEDLPIGICYSAVDAGCAVAIAGSHGFVEVGVFGGRADRVFGTRKLQVSLYLQ
jgi:S-adenosyl-L-methionine hydrolase (adenosine-forming)